MTLGVKWDAYSCADYLSSRLAQTGWWDEEGQCWYILRADRAYEDEARALLVIGGPGVDGIVWGYRRGHSGVWAYYPMDDELVLIAESALDLEAGYASGRIRV